MTVLVTGGAGYLGSALVPELLRRGHTVRVLDALMFGDGGLAAVKHSPQLDLVYGDVREPRHVARAAQGCQVVLHLAALVGEPACSVNPALTEAINYQACLNVLQAARAGGVERLVFASTCSNYGLQQELADEDAELRPLSLYAETKVRAETEVLRAGGGVVRLATLYGLAPRMRFNLLVNQLAREAVLRRTVSLYGSDAWRPYVHVADAARAFATLAEAPRASLAGQVYNVGSANARKSDVVALIRTEVPDLTLAHSPVAPDQRDYRVTFERFVRSFGFQADRTLADGVRELCGALRGGRFPEPFDPRYDLWIDEARLAAALAAPAA